MVREDQPGDLRLVVYISGAAGEAGLRAALARELPDHMRPAHYVAVERFPLTPNRKVDRKALPAPIRFLPDTGPAAPEALAPVVAFAVAPSQPGVGRGGVGPVTGPATGPANGAANGPALGTEIAKIWARVLGVARVGPKDNFFALGGHSLLAVQTHREIRERLPQVKVSITDIFRFPVLDALVAHISGGAPAAVVPVRAPVFAPASALVAAVAPVQVSPAPVAVATGLDEAMARRRAMRLARRGMDA